MLDVPDMANRRAYQLNTLKARWSCLKADSDDDAFAGFTAQPVSLKTCTAKMTIMADHWLRC
jgi:hypothetical protein